MNVCFRGLSKRPCWDLLLLSPTSMHPLGWRQIPALPPSGTTALWLRASEYLPHPSPAGLRASCWLARGPAGDDGDGRSLGDPDSLLKWWR